MRILKLEKGFSEKKNIGVRLHNFTKYKKEWLHDKIEYRNL